MAVWAAFTCMGAATTTSARAETTRTRPNVLCSPEHVEFAEVPLAPTSTDAVATILVRNLAETPLVVVGARVLGRDSRDFTVLDTPLQGLVEGGESFAIRVRFTPRALGERIARLNLALGSAATPALDLPLTGRGIPSDRDRAPDPPVATLASGQLFMASLASTAAEPWLPVDITWSAVPGDGSTRYELQWSENEGPFENVVLPSPQSRAITRLMRVSQAREAWRYRFRVRAVIGELPGPWSTARAFTLLPVRLDDEEARWSGEWSAAGPDFLGDGVARWRVTGRGSFVMNPRVSPGVATSLAWITRKGPDRGMASVSIDERRPIKLDLYAPEASGALPVSIASPCAPEAMHSITIRSLGRHHGQAQGERVEVGGVVLLTELPDQAPLLVTLFGGAAELSSGVPTLLELQAARAWPDPSSLIGTSEPPEDPTALPRPRLAFTGITPNPSATSTHIAFTLPRDGGAHVRVVDVSGRSIRTLLDDYIAAGPHRADWDGVDDQGMPVKPGMYFVSLRFEDRTLLARLVRR